MILKDSNLGDLQVRLFGRHKVSLLSTFPLDQEEQLACSKQWLIEAVLPYMQVRVFLKGHFEKK